MLGLLLGGTVSQVVASVRAGTDLGFFWTFMLSLGLGTLGAVVYLTFQLVSDKEMVVLAQITHPRYGFPSWALVCLFLFAGGIVAALCEVTSGSFVVGDVWPTFLIGFGWQGVVSGIGGAAAVGEKDTEAQGKLESLKRKSDENLEEVVNGAEVKIRRLQEQVTRAASARPPEVPPGESLGTVVVV